MEFKLEAALPAFAGLIAIVAMKVMVMEHSTHIKRNTQPISKGILILLKGTQRNTHHGTLVLLKGTLILLKGTQRNTHIIKRNSLIGTLI